MTKSEDFVVRTEIETNRKKPNFSFSFQNTCNNIGYIRFFYCRILLLKGTFTANRILFASTRGQNLMIKVYLQTDRACLYAVGTHVPLPSTPGVSSSSLTAYIGLYARRKAIKYWEAERFPRR